MCAFSVVPFFEARRKCRFVVGFGIVAMAIPTMRSQSRSARREESASNRHGNKQQSLYTQELFVKVRGKLGAASSQQ